LKLDAGYLSSEIRVSNRECFMQTTMASSICPLCKSPSGANATSNPTPTRLCDQCRSMLTTILPQAVAGSVVIVDAQKPSTQQLAAPTAIDETNRQPYGNEAAFAFEAKVQAAETIAAPMLRPDPQGDADINSFDSSTEPVLFHTEERFEPQSSQVEASESFFIQAEEKAEDQSVQAEADYLRVKERLEDPYIQGIQAEEITEADHVRAEEKSQPSFRELEFINPPPTNSPIVEQRQRESEAQPPRGDFFVAPEASQLVVQENWHTQEAAPLYTQEAAPQHFYPQEAEYQTDQPVLEEVAPVWDNTMDNYPVLMVQEERRLRFKPLMALAAISLIALVAAGYWFVYKPFFGGTTPNATQRAGANVEDDTRPAKPDQSAENASPAPQPESPVAASTPPATQPPPEDKPATPSESNPHIEGQNGQGRFSLQAASFPSEQAASEFSEKLIRSGVPAYIASADIAGKGRWFRVRVGRFANAADAEKFAAQAKQRAKATGLNLQLVICDYSNS
jgi:cell division septation protein DedD